MHILRYRSLPSAMHPNARSGVGHGYTDRLRSQEG